ncbi:MAG TPA: hydrogenase maturation protease [Candidatus Limnocylindrales bacterium]|nr:hydrogenase maturation protease [Candidatus Limnocylindrales bacterium]
MSSANERPQLLIFGIGNPFRSDDAAGIELARLLRERVPAGVRVIEETGEGAALLDAWRDAPGVILVDAACSGAPPGTLHRLDLRSQEIPREFFRFSTHAFGVAEAVKLARALNRLPPRLIFHGIEGKEFASGEGLSPEVVCALSTAIERILEDVRALMDQPIG